MFISLLFIEMRFFLHYSLHFLAPGLFARGFYPQKWKRVWGIFLLTMLVDLDHLFSDPVYDPNRLSIGHHFLHSYPAIAFYVVLCFFKKTRIAGFGLVFHMITDGIDYLYLLLC